jgi:glycosyltransferase involved in cell wall biosynthesis
MDRTVWPRITIITPSFNQGDFLEDTILSILNQNYPNLEYFIVDGGSTDNTLDVIKKYEGRIDWWVSESDRGQSHAINKGMERATGEIINWINSDDLLFPNALQHVAVSFMQHPDADLFVGDTARIDQKGYIKSISSPPSKLSFASKYFILPIGQQSSFFAAKALKKINMIREDLHILMDQDLYYRIISSGGKYIKIKKMIGAIRDHQLAKGSTCQQEWIEERSKYFDAGKVSFFEQNIIQWIIKLMRIIDGSIPRGRKLTRRFKGEKVKGTGWVTENLV